MARGKGPAAGAVTAEGPAVVDDAVGPLLSVLHALMVIPLWVVSEVVGCITMAIILPTVRWYLDNFAILYRRYWYWSEWMLCLDGYCPNDGVEIAYGELYGNGPDENMDVVTPGGGEDNDRSAPVLVYLHGGGFVACTSQCLLHSVPIPMARNGYRVYSINYPLAPENRFPDPVIATIRALAFIKAHAGVESVVLMGDSAGGAVASTVTAIMSADGMYAQLTADVNNRHGGPGWRVMPARSAVPEISKLISIYGVMDWKGWSNERDPVTSKVPTMLWNDHIGAAVLRFCLGCFCPERSALRGRCLLSDFGDSELANFPPCLLLCGTWDPLVYGNREMYRRLSALGRDVQIEEYPSHHAFLGFPVAWNFIRWQDDAWPAYSRLAHFVLGRKPTTPPGWPKQQTLDPTLPAAIMTALLLLPFVFVIVLVGKLHALSPFQSVRKGMLKRHI
mmetsp:Transcript_32400/g.84804  ORF Transcript_32400/g.84804 Transcript_32400/m.84804 type:complete len:448 (-) Transcript_32400:50-1393(-)